ncbi:Centrosomal protein of 78 kDa [Homalodisca vitripennis]|nr:Centrosomal protein of 78 kDa [Homalodisca vitripennis]
MTRANRVSTTNPTSLWCSSVSCTQSKDFERSRKTLSTCSRLPIDYDIYEAGAPRLEHTILQAYGVSPWKNRILLVSLTFNLIDLAEMGISDEEFRQPQYGHGYGWTLAIAERRMSLSVMRTNVGVCHGPRRFDSYFPCQVPTVQAPFTLVNGLIDCPTFLYNIDFAVPCGTRSNPSFSGDAYLQATNIIAVCQGIIGIECIDFNFRVMVDMIPSVQERKKNVHNFMNSYPYLCRLQNLVPNPSIKIDCSNFVLDFFGDRLKLDDWKPVLEAISNDRSLHFISIRSKHTKVKVIQDIGTDSQGRQGVPGTSKSPPLFTSSVLVKIVEALSKCLTSSTALTGLLLEKVPLKGSLTHLNQVIACFH